MPKWKSENGDCFKPFKELCQIEWSTIMVWVFLLMSTFVLGAKEAFQLMHSQKVSSKLCTEVENGHFLSSGSFTSQVLDKNSRES